MTVRQIEVDAKDQVLGRFATRVALALRGKDQASYRPDRLAEVRVKVINIRQLKFTGRKLQQKIYHRFSGYPGGLKSIQLEKLFSQHPDRVLRQAVKRMLPNNRLRDRWLRHLEII